MAQRTRRNDTLFSGEKRYLINACEHFAGSEKQHAEMVVAMAKSSLNKHRKAGVRIHDQRHAL
jgi:hypothetical protein